MALGPSADLWAKIRMSVEGYANPEAVPIVHKDAAVLELLAQIEAAQDEDDPEDQPPGSGLKSPGVRFLAYWTLHREQMRGSPTICLYSEDGESHGLECDITRIEELITSSTAGALLLRADAMDFALKAGLLVSLADTTTAEFAAPQVLRLERYRWQRECSGSDTTG